MNGIGIDLGTTVCRVQIGESVAGRYVFHALSDGVRRAIPRLAGVGGGWASGATDEEGFLAGQAGELAFFRGLYARLRAHLGGLRPEPRDGWRVTIACEAEVDVDALRHLLGQAGFDRCTLVTPTQALLAVHAMSPSAATGPGRVISGVAVGENQVEVRSMRLAEVSRPQAQSGRVLLTGTGHAVWRGHLRQVLIDRLSAPPSLPRRLSIDDSIAAYALELAEVTPQDEHAWIGAGADDLFSSLGTNRTDMRDWPHVRLLEARLPLALQQTLRELGVDAPNLVVLGGPGSVWPFVRDALPGELPIWRSAAVESLVAQGAALWPALNAPAPSGLRSEPDMTAKQTTDPGGIGRADAASNAAPWRRIDPFAFGQGDLDA